MANPKDYRKFMKGDLWVEMRGKRTDQQRQLAPLPVEKPYPKDAALIDLVDPAVMSVGGDVSVREAIARRQSHRAFTEEVLTQ
jgi:hypothetical protein